MLPSLCLPKWLLSLYDIYRTIPCMMQLRTWRIWTWLYRRFSGFSQQYQCEHVTVHDTHTGIKCKYCSINFIRLQTFSHFVVCCLYVCTYLYTYIHSKQLQSKRLLTALAGFPFAASIYPVLCSVLLHVSSHSKHLKLS